MTGHAGTARPTSQKAPAPILAGPGKLVLVVGPSGAGKDTLIEAARRHLAHDPGFVFPRRTVTRPCQSAAEAHDTVSKYEFRQLAKNGAFCLHWQAHGLHYGIPGSAARAIGEGRSVVVNVSRSVINTAKARFGRVTVINVTAPREVLMARLAARNRTTDGDLARRLDRDVVLPKGAVVEIATGRPVQESISLFLDAIKAA